MDEKLKKMGAPTHLPEPTAEDEQLVNEMFGGDMKKAADALAQLERDGFDDDERR